MAACYASSARSAAGDGTDDVSDIGSGCSLDPLP